MSSAFVPLETFLRPRVQERDEPVEPAAIEPPARTYPGECEETLGAVRRYRAALRDALDAALEELLPTIARDVLARELRLMPADVGAIVASALDRFRPEKVLAVRAHPTDLGALAQVGFERIADESLQRGDIRFHLQSGTIDLTLATRLDSALAAWTV